jgi:hypothetical protein
LSVSSTEPPCLRSGRLRALRWWRRDGPSDLWEEVEELCWQLAQVGLHWPQLAAAPEEKREIQASVVARLQLLKDCANVVCTLAQLGEFQWLFQQEWAIKIEPPARLGARRQ